ncbi:MAG: hypothetical protein ACREK8_01880 [Gemmatimonadales bacterium]
MRAPLLFASLAIVAIASLAGCGDSRLDKLSIGITKDSASHAIGDVPHRELSYLTSGKIWEVQLYSRHSVDARDSINWRAMSPVVFINHRVVGWGWSWWGDEAAKQKIAMPAR